MCKPTTLNMNNMLSYISKSQKFSVSKKYEVLKDGNILTALSYLRVVLRFNTVKQTSCICNVHRKSMCHLFLIKF